MDLCEQGIPMSARGHHRGDRGTSMPPALQPATKAVTSERDIGRTKAPRDGDGASQHREKLTIEPPVQ